MATAPDVATNRSSDYMKVFAAGFANATDLTAQSGKPACAAQEVYAINKNASSFQDLVCVDEGGNSHTIPVPPGKVLPIPHPIKTLNTSGADIVVIAFWWDHGDVAAREHVISKNA
jgi:hypothetical protein